MSDPRPAHLQQLLFAAAGGDQHAWREVVETYSARVFALLRSQGLDAELAEEIAQSTFVTVAAKIGEYVEVGRFEAWLFRIAMNRLRDEMRRRKRQAASVETDALIGLAGETAAEPAAYEPAELARLRQALARLSDSDREIIQLRHYADLSFREISEVLGEPLGTVLARQHRALRKLADLIEQMEGDVPRYGR